MGLVIHIGSTKNPRNGKCWYSLTHWTRPLAIVATASRKSSETSVIQPPIVCRRRGPLRVNRVDCAVPPVGPPIAQQRTCCLAIDPVVRSMIQAPKGEQ